MRNLTRLTGLLSLFPALVGAARASMVEIPYSFSNGKVAGSYEVSMHSGDLAFGSSRPTPDTLKIAALTLRFFMQPGPYPTVCGYKAPIGVQVLVGSFGMVHQRADTSAAWSEMNAFSSGTMIPLDSVTGIPLQAASYADTMRAPGYYLVEMGQRSTCSGAEYFFRPGWNRVLIARWGSGVDYAGKFSFHAHRDTTFGTLPFYQVLRSITVRYVLNTTSTDLSDPVSIHPARPERGVNRFGAGVAHDLYNPLGIRLRRDAGRFEPAVPSPRKR